MQTSLTDRTACPGLELLNCKLLANPAAVADHCRATLLQLAGQHHRVGPTLYDLQPLWLRSERYMTGV